MKIRKRLTPEEALQLGLEVKPTDKGRTTARYMITSNDWDLVSINRVKPNKRKFVETIKKFGKDGEIISSTEKLQSKPIEVPDNFEVIKVSTSKTTGQQWVQYAPKKEDEVLLDATFDYIGELEKQFKEIKPILIKCKGKNNGVATLTDFHFGAYISAMNITPEFSISILCKMLNQAANKINRLGYKTVHIHILGDLIESFTGMNHKNSWKGLDKGMFGVSAIKLFTKLFKLHFLDLINNLGKIKMVAGNHDRLTSDNNEDTDGGAAELIAYALELIGYDIEFARDVLTHEVDGINYILNHGHLGFTNKKTTQEVCWMYGKKGLFNFIMEGHLHSRIRKLSAKAVTNFKMVSDDNIDCRRQVCPSFFTGNSYSEDGGWSTLAGFTISEASINKNGVDVYDISL